MEMGVMIFLGILGAAVIGGLTVWVLKLLKGSVKIILNQAAASSGEFISGRVQLKTKSCSI